MTEPNKRTVDLLKGAMRQESERAMSTTNSNRELERFRETIEDRRRKRPWAVLAVATAAGAAVVAGFIVTHASTGKDASPAATHSGSAASTSSAAPVAAGALAIESPSALPSSVTVSQLAPGPGLLVADAFGAIWGVADPGTMQRGDTGTVYRVAQDGSRVLSATQYAGMLPDTSAFRAGDVFMVPTITGFSMFGPDGRAAGSVAVPGLPDDASGAGDSTGAWATVADDAVARIDGKSHKIVKTVRLRNANIVSIAVGGGSVWVADKAGSKIWQLDEKTGHVIKSGIVPDVPWMVTWGRYGVYESGETFQLNRLDPRTLKVTATVTGNFDEFWITMSTAPDGSLWAEIQQGAVAQLDPVTLATKTSVQAFPATGDGGSFGTLVANGRVFKGNAGSEILYSYPRY